MATRRKHDDELRERAPRMAVETRKDPAARTGAIRDRRPAGRAPEALRAG